MAEREECDLDLLDSKESCSICLEPYSGRQPKLLPCFHTFCLPCLAELAQVSASRAEEGDDCCSITCPACRKVITVPPGGVEHFQCNFYIAHDDDATTATVIPHTPLCQLCDSREDINHTCPRCGNFCDRCHRIHSKLCSSVASADTTTTTTATLTHPSPTWRVKGEDQDVLEAVFRVLQDNLKQVQHQHQEVEVRLHARYAEGIRLLTQARDACVSSLEEATNSAERSVQSEIDLTQKERMKTKTQAAASLSSSPSRSRSPSSLPSHNRLQKELPVSEDIMERFRGHLNSGSGWNLCYEPVPLSAYQDNCFQQFMGKVRVRDGTVSHSNGSSDCIVLSGLLRGKEEASVMTTQLLNILVQRLETLNAQLMLVEQKTSSLQRELESVRQQQQQQHNSSTVTQERLMREVASCHKGLQSIQDKNALMCHDLAILHDLKVKVGQLDRVQGQDETTAAVDDGVSGSSRDVREMRATVVAHGDALADLGACLAKFRTQVAFHVLLHSDMRVRTQKVLVLRNEVVNIGNAYSTDTGYFTAPISGIYLFMATACSADTGKPASLDLVHEGRDIAYLGTSNESSTCHVATKVGQGERVWLRTIRPKEEGCRYLAAGWLTSFSGVLVHPDC